MINKQTMRAVLREQENGFYYDNIINNCNNVTIYKNIIIEMEILRIKQTEFKQRKKKITAKADQSRIKKRPKM